jgi:hypothetical protein
MSPTRIAVADISHLLSTTFVRLGYKERCMLTNANPQARFVEQSSHHQHQQNVDPSKVSHHGYQRKRLAQPALPALKADARVTVDALANGYRAYGLDLLLLLALLLLPFMLIPCPYFCFTSNR